MKPAMNPKTVKLALKIAAVTLAIATAVVAKWDAGVITDAASFVSSVAEALASALGDADEQGPTAP